MRGGPARPRRTVRPHPSRSRREQGVRGDPRTVAAEGAIPVQLDITDQASVLAAAEQAQDVTLLINNAGILTPTSVMEGDFDTYRLEYDTNVLGTLDVTRAFAPALAHNGAG